MNEKIVVLQVFADKEIHARLKRIATKRGMKIQFIYKTALEEYATKIENEEKTKEENKEINNK